MKRETSREIDLLKIICLGGVIMIHCNPMTFISSVTDDPTRIVFDNIQLFIDTSVPFFFILSGYLFFNFTDFSFATIRRKWKSRVKTLLVPYLLWCTIYGIIRIVKAKYLGFDGDGIVEDGEVSLTGFLRGYWDTGDGYPMGFVLWFVRNLIIFNIVAPLVFYIGKYWAAAIGVMALPGFGIDCHGLEFYVFGAALGLHRVDFSALASRHVWLLTGLWIALMAFVGFVVPEMIFILRYVGIFIAMGFVGKLDGLFAELPGIVKKISNKVFFIYAVHGLYSTVIVKTFIGLMGAGGIWTALWCFFGSWIVNVALSTVILIITARISPQLMNLLSGGRYIVK